MMNVNNHLVKLQEESLVIQDKIGDWKINTQNGKL
jgi:hypothetical protein